MPKEDISHNREFAKTIIDTEILDKKMGKTIGRNKKLQQSASGNQKDYLSSRNTQYKNNYKVPTVNFKFVGN